MDTCNPANLDKDDTWYLPESYLGILWDDVFQRLVVYLWYLELFYLEQKSLDNLAKLGLIDEGDCNADLSGVIVANEDDLEEILIENREYPCQ